LLPTDKKEALRLENQHRLCYTILDGNLHLPWITIPPATKILDLGTSSGIWAIEMANQYPTSTVIGVDISPQQTGRPPIPHNCSFQFYDIENARLPYEDNSFDFIHIRDMQSVIKNWPTFLKEINRILVPGGWAMFGEFLYLHYCACTAISKFRFEQSPIKKLERTFHQFARVHRLTVFKQFTLTKLLIASGGWTPPTEEIIKVPIALWNASPRGRMLGGQMLCNLMDGLNSFGAEMLEAQGMGKDEAAVLITEVDKQYRDSRWEMSMHMMYCAVKKLPVSKAK